MGEAQLSSRTAGLLTFIDYSSPLQGRLKEVKIFAFLISHFSFLISHLKNHFSFLISNLSFLNGAPVFAPNGSHIAIFLIIEFHIEAIRIDIVETNHISFCDIAVDGSLAVLGSIGSSEIP